jgi:hypothetical protein
MINAGKAAQLKQFADAIAQIGRIPGASQYVAPLQPAVRLIQEIAAEDAKRTTKTTEPANQPLQAAQIAVAASKSHSPFPYRKTEAVAAVQDAQSETPPIPAAPPMSSYYMVAGNGLAEQCRFVGTPKMLCLNEFSEGTKIVSDVIVSSGCTSDIVVMGRIAIEPDWVVYVPAGRGADVHGATLPLRPGRTLTVGVAYKSEGPTPDMRCGVTVVWRPWNDHGKLVQPVAPSDPRAKALAEKLRAKVDSGKAVEQERVLLRALCRQLGDDSCSF